MSGAVDEVLPMAGVGDNATRRAVDLLALDARPHGIVVACWAARTMSCISRSSAVGSPTWMVRDVSEP